MPSDQADRRLLEHVRTAHLLRTTAAVLSWDQEVMLPPGGVAWRAEQLALLAGLVHERAVDPRVEEWLAACEQDPRLRQDPFSDFAANVRELRRDYEQCKRLPAPLVQQLAETESLAQHEWAEARARSDYGRFRPWLDRLLRLHRDKAACLRDPRRHAEAWDALLDLHEPGATAAQVDAMFRELAQRHRAIIGHATEGRNGGPDPFQGQPIDDRVQESFVREVLVALGFDLERGRLDRSTHPFCTGTGGDVRLTTRFTADGLLDALGSTMHEGGHGLYEQGLDPARLGTPLGEAVSLGIHESQSRLWENHVGRSRAFWRWCAPVLRRHVSTVHADEAVLFAACNRVQPGLIRVEADEATYDLHVLIRFQIERALLSGTLGTADLPAAWNAAYREQLGVVVPDDRRGCLQDVHWSCGLFGYFPTYTFGNLYAAQFAEAARAALGDLDAMLARGEFAPLREWLRVNVHRHGRRFPPAELCRRATGRELSAEPFLTHLERRVAEAAA